MKLNYQQEVLVLPASVLSQGDADQTALRVLLWLASDLTLAEKPRQLAKLADCTIAAVNTALEFWSARGVLIAETAKDGSGTAEKSVTAKETESASGDAETVRKEPTAKKTLRRADELPSYTSTELAELLEKRATVRALVDEAQSIVGKLFNPSEINILIGMYDYLGISEEGILLLLAHCRKIGKLNLRSVEKYAYKLVDRDITTPDALEEEFRTVEAMHTFEGQVRTMFGMKSRALTSREEKMLRAWVGFGYDIEIIRRAYEMTVSATNTPSVAYANAILERWHADGLKTLSEIEAAEEQKKGKKDSAPFEPTLGNSFDSDDFFEAALQRSFREITSDSKDSTT